MNDHPDTIKFPSGAVRSNDADSERYDLITPIGLRRLALTCAEGEAKYGAHNWTKGIRSAQGVVRFRHPAVQYRDAHGAAGLECPVVLPPR